MVDLVQALDIVGRAGVVGLLALAIVGGYKGWYLWRGHHEDIVKLYREDRDEMERDRDFWRDQAIGALTAAQKAVVLADRASEKS